MECDFANEVLIVSGSTTALIPADTEVGFVLSGFKNPIEGAYVDGFVISTRMRSGSDYYIIDKEEGSISIS